MHIKYLDVLDIFKQFNFQSTNSIFDDHNCNKYLETINNSYYFEFK